MVMRMIDITRTLSTDQRHNICHDSKIDLHGAGKENQSQASRGVHSQQRRHRQYQQDEVVINFNKCKDNYTFTPIKELSPRISCRVLNVPSYHKGATSKYLDSGRNNGLIQHNRRERIACPADSLLDGEDPLEQK